MSLASTVMASRATACSLLVAVAASLAVAACGDIEIKPVDHSCPVENACQHAGGR
jgi:hypothetical protein